MEAFMIYILIHRTFRELMVMTKSHALSSGNLGGFINTLKGHSVIHCTCMQQLKPVQCCGTTSPKTFDFQYG